MRALGPSLPLLAAAALLPGCVAAVVPLAAGGVIARRAATGHQGRGDPATPAPAASAGAAAAVGITPAPSDPTRMAPGAFYAGILPAPQPLPAPIAGAASTPAVDVAPAAVDLSGAAGGWPALVRFVATHKSAPGHGALMARGSTVAAPRWTACAGKPTAVLAPAALIVGGAGGGSIAAGDLGWIVALPTMGTALVVIAASPAEAVAVRRAFARAGLPTPVAGDTLIVATKEADLPAARATVGARYCVLALAGLRASDFPNALLPASTPPALAAQWRAGWFLFDPG